MDMNEDFMNKKTFTKNEVGIPTKLLISRLQMP